MVRTVGFITIALTSRAQVLQYIAADEVDLCIVQQMTLKAAFQASVNALPKAWLSIGQAIRVAMDLGLHVSDAGSSLTTALDFADEVAFPGEADASSYLVGCLRC